MLKRQEFATYGRFYPGRFGKYDAPVSIRNPREVNNAERDVVRV
jgi:hypothetical protein